MIAGPAVDSDGCDGTAGYSVIRLFRGDFAADCPGSPAALQSAASQRDTSGASRVQMCTTTLIDGLTILKSLAFFP